VAAWTGLRGDVDLLVFDVRVVDRRAAIAGDSGRQRRPPRRPRVAALVVLGAALAAALSMVAALWPAPTRLRGPQVVARIAPGGGLSQVVGGFGSAWVLDNGDDLLLRMDPVTRRVTARLPLRAAIAVADGRDALWVGEGINDLLRIDPASGHVVARIPLARGAFSGGSPIPIGDAIWVVGSERALRVDARTGRVTRAVAVAADGGAAALRGDLVVVGGGSVVRLDGRTGARRAAFPAPFPGQPVAAGGALFLADANRVARLDPTSGRLLWRRRLDRVGPVAAARGLLWAEATGPGGDRVLGIDPRSGRDVASVHVGEFGVLSMHGVGAELWLATAGGDVVVVRP
jgi:outer membrane protein assembly factor BamB